MLPLAWVGAALAALVVWLGLVTPFDHPTRTQVDNALLLLGALGLLNTLLLVRTRLVSTGTALRVALACYALLSAAAVGLADFGSSRTAGWVIKAVGAVVLLFTLRELATAGDG
jgi:hypothetical protein